MIGPARSGTTILAQLINASDRAFMTTEAFFHREGGPRAFRDRYNGQHLEYGNQVCKSSYAPNFAPGNRDAWWQWLTGAAGHYDLVGDKLAFTYHHFEETPPERTRDFYENRFFRSKYLFVFRDPVQALLGCSVLGMTDGLSLVRGWATMVKLWADMIRIFPSTMTVLLEDLNAAKVGEIGDFLGLDLAGSARLLDPREQRRHRSRDISWGEAVVRVGPLLQMIYGEMKDAIRMDRVMLQADQKREPMARPGDGRPNPTLNVAMVSTPLGRAWNLADQLLTGVTCLQAEAPPPKVSSAP